MALTDDQKKAVESIVQSIRRGVVIPIIGYDMLYNEFEGDSNIDFLKLLIKEQAERDSNIKQKMAEFESEFEDEKRPTGYELINFYYHNLGSADKENFKMDLSDTIKKIRDDVDITPESLRKLVSIKYFNLFINATFTNSLTSTYNSYRANGARQNLQTSYSVLSYRPNTPDKLPKEARTRPFFKIDLEKSRIKISFLIRL